MIIWTNDIDFEKDWKDDLLEEYPDASEEELRDLAYEINEDYFNDEKINLNKELHRPIVVFADLGLWYGRRSAYKFLKGTNLNNCLGGTCGDYITWYTEDGELMCKDIHHDGTNYYTYRVLKPDITEYEFEEEYYDNKNAVEEMTEPLGRYVEEIYGVV